MQSYKAFSLLILCFISACASVPKQAFDDNDADGIANELDACPKTPAGVPTNAVGCSAFNGRLEGVAFGPGDHRLTSDSRASLEALVAMLKTHKEVNIRLGGHTDNRGLAKDNLELSKRRVMSVVKYLVANGINGERLQPYGFGESQPVVSNKTPEGRAENRRIEISVVNP